jgi:geranylgeranyl pyrophosphate synthase
MIYTLSHAAGMQGMAAGQALDLQGVNTLEALIELHQLKTGKLFSASTTLGLIAANQYEQSIHTALNTFSDCLGLAFQIQDDLLDIEGPAEITGKSAGRDAMHDKITYPILVTKEKARAHIHDLYQNALNTIHFLGPKADILRSLADYILQRKK